MGGPAPSLHRESTDSLILCAVSWLHRVLICIYFVAWKMMKMVSISITLSYTANSSRLGGYPPVESDKRKCIMQLTYILNFTRTCNMIYEIYNGGVGPIREYVT